MIPDKIKEKVEQFRDNRDLYKSTDFKEHQLEQQFINPFWEALGWDVANDQGLAHGYQDVIVQPGLRIDGTMKAPDYVFRAGSEKKFYLEVKAPKVNIAKDPAPAHQLKRYSWTAGLSISLLSNFEEFAVYQTTAVPKPTDPPFKDRIEFFGYEQYEEKWDWLWENFSREAIWKGRFDKYAAQAKGKRGTTPFDKAFLADMHDWRKRLAENIALRNKGLSEAELNFAVQVTLDRIIMLRICEDRKIEQYGNLALDAGLNSVLGLKKDRVEQTSRLLSDSRPRLSTQVYKNLLKRFAQADDRFNSGLFHFKKEKGREYFDALTPRLAIDDKVLTDIIKHLYYPESPYAFDIVPSDILGHVYEKFLGQVITLTKGGNARVEDKPEVKKAGGVYYTPTYIVDYIVKNTVGPLLSVDRVSTRSLPLLKILDPACGSGSFLLGAYQYLLDWYLKYYLENNPESYAKKKVLDAIPTADPNKKEYHLSIAERKRILLEHIHGVDIDSSAVEVAKLNLMLKVLEGGHALTGDKSAHRIAYDVSERLLPDLDKNIVCGNSLIGLDYFDQFEFETGSGDRGPGSAKSSRRTPVPGARNPDSRTPVPGSRTPDNERAKINAMDWRDAFPEIMKRGGFDVVIGNPPYLAGREWTEDLWACRTYFQSHYACMDDQYDLYALFMERGLKLLRQDGQFGFITPNTWLNSDHYLGLREWISGFASVKLIGDYRDVNVFEQATVLPIVFIAAKEKVDDRNEVLIEHFDSPTISHSFTSAVEHWKSFPGLIFNLSLRGQDVSILKKVESGSTLTKEHADVRFGVKVYQKGKGKPPQTGLEAPEKLYEASKKLNSKYLPYARGKDVNRWAISENLAWLKYGLHLAEPRTIELFEGPRILVRRIVGERLVLTVEERTIIADQLLHTVKPHDGVDAYALAGQLGSRLIAFYFKMRYNRTEKTFPEIRVAELGALPIRSLAAPRIALLVKKAITLSNELTQKHSAADRTLIDRQIAATDREIDRLVYALYGLNEEEIKIVEG